MGKDPISQTLLGHPKNLTRKQVGRGNHLANTSQLIVHNNHAGSQFKGRKKKTQPCGIWKKRMQDTDTMYTFALSVLSLIFF